MSISYRRPFAWSAPMSSAAQASPSSLRAAPARFALTFARTRRLYANAEVRDRRPEAPRRGVVACSQRVGEGLDEILRVLVHVLVRGPRQRELVLPRRARAAGGAGARPSIAGRTARKRLAVEELVGAMFVWPSIVYLVDSPSYAVGPLLPAAVQLLTVCGDVLRDRDSRSASAQYGIAGQCSNPHSCSGSFSEDCCRSRRRPRRAPREPLPAALHDLRSTRRFSTSLSCLQLLRRLTIGAARASIRP